MHKARPSLSLGTRLLLPLLPTVALIMVVYALWALDEREDTLAVETRQETQAYATALALAFEYALRDVKHEKVQEILNQVSQAPTVYGVIVYDSTGVPTFASNPLRTPGTPAEPILRQVLTSGQPAIYERQIEDQRVHSVLRAIRGPGGRVTGALEVAQPVAFVEQEKAGVRQRFLWNTLTLLTGLTLVMLWLVRRVVTKPMEALVTAAHAIGRGDLAYRFTDRTDGRELQDLAREFNAMAENLERARAAADRDAEERVELERRLSESEKLAAVGNLAAGLAHEIAAPLNVISGRAELVLRRTEEAPARERHLRIIIQQIGRITTIVRNLLDFARRREPHLQQVDLADAIDGVAEFLDSELERAGVTLVRPDERGLRVCADPDLLHQVLVNLILNAVQAMEHSGTDRRICLRAGSDAGGAWIELEDSGPGIAPEVLARLFEPFYTTKPRGTGLGLGVARTIVEQHGGQLTAGNALRGGAVFRFTLPLAEVAHEVPAGV
jgi:two-component system NtrC family sensor kinase